MYVYKWRRRRMESVCAKRKKLRGRNLIFDLEKDFANCQNARGKNVSNLPKYAGNMIQGRALALASLKWTARRRRSIEKRSTATFRPD